MSSPRSGVNFREKRGLTVEQSALKFTIKEWYEMSDAYFQRQLKDTRDGIMGHWYEKAMEKFFYPSAGAL